MSRRYEKLKTNLKLAIQRLKLLEKKKSENTKKSTKEIADYIVANKYDRARIKVEHIIREDYLVEAMEIVEMYCDLLLARMGIIESMKELDPGLDECVASLFWVTPRLESECPELKIIYDELQSKYGKEFATKCRSDELKKVNTKLLQKLNEQAPSRLLVEKYLVEIANSHRIDFKPDPELAVRDYEFFYNSLEKNNGSLTSSEKKLIDYNDDENEKKGGGNNGGGGGSGGGMSAPSAPLYPAAHSMNHYERASNVVHPSDHQQPPPPRYSAKPTSAGKHTDLQDINFPDVPNTLPTSYKVPPPRDDDGSDSLDDLTKRFEKFKKK